MRNVLIAAALLIGAGSLMTGMSNQPVPSASANVSAPQAASAQTKAGGVRNAILPGDGGGHFKAAANIGSHRVDFLVDTGASLVALMEADAQRMGIQISNSDPRVRLQTANGTISAPKVRLASITIGGVTVQDIEAVVLPPTALRQNLLGMTFLSRLTRYEFRSGQLVLEQ